MRVGPEDGQLEQAPVRLDRRVGAVLLVRLDGREERHAKIDGKRDEHHGDERATSGCGPTANAASAASARQAIGIRRSGTRG